MAQAHVLIQKQTLASAVSSVTFSSVPQTYRDLVLVITASTSGNSLTQLRFNGDATTAYGFATLEYGTQAGQSSNTALPFVWVGSFDLSTIISNVTSNIFDYTLTTNRKTVLTRVTSPAFTGTLAAGNWNNTAAITSVTVLANNSATYNVGSTFSLYGVLA